MFTLILCALIAFIGWWRGDVTSLGAGSIVEDSELSSSGKQLSEPIPLSEPTTLNQSPTTDNLEQLRQDSIAAAQETARAEARIEELDAQITALEMQISDIERRGDDPVDHADEVMPYLQPALAEFLDAQALLEKALDDQASAEAALAAALLADKSTR